MRVFVSYRRGDAAGRAGRLRDSLVVRLGETNVFQDVGSVRPGGAFDAEILSALAASDATLVVIGQEWPSSTDAAGRRRLDDPADWVRREVVAALASGQPVVPVLVGGAALPAAESLPEDLRPLVGRQAFILSDDDWHHDVDGLIERLEHPTPTVRTRARARRLPLAGGGLFLALALTAGALHLRSLGGSGTDTLPSCTPADRSWEQLDLTGSSPVIDRIGDPAVNVLRFTVRTARVRVSGSDAQVVLGVELANESPPVHDSKVDDWYYSVADLQRLVVDGRPLEAGPSCFGPFSGDQSLLPGQRATAEIGFNTPVDPRSGLAIETRSFHQLVVTPTSAQTPWRLVVQQTDASVRCTMTATNAATGDKFETTDVNGPAASFQMRGEADQWTVSGPGPCLWRKEPGAGAATLPFSRPGGYGDTGAFAAPGPLKVTIEDTFGQGTCVVTLHALADGTTLGRVDLTPGTAESGQLDPGNAVRVYISTTFCALRIEAAR